MVIAVSIGFLLFGQGLSATACFGKKKSKDVSDASVTREVRQVSATKINLTEGTPPALLWAASGTPKAIVLCLHELGMHKGVFENLGTRMSKEGMTVYAIDLRGFGDWKQIEGKQSRMSLDRTLADVKSSVEALHKQHPGLPVFILGEAMGGAVALKAAARYPDIIQGVISSAPGGEHFDTGSNYWRVGTNYLAGKNKDCGMGPELIEKATPKPALQQALKKDADVRLDLTPRELMACQFFMYKTRNFARKIKDAPVMIVQGMKDGESRPEGSEKVYKNLSTPNKKMLSVESGDHYVYEDVQVDDKAFNDTLSFIDECLAKKTPQG